MPESAPNILILGGGFAGVYTARRLEKLLSPAEATIMLVSRQNYFLVTPLLFEAGSGILDPRHAVCPLRAMLRRTEFVQAEVLEIDVAARRVRVAVEDGPTHEIPYDQLVLALGGTTNTAIIPGSETAMSFKTLGDAMYLRNHAIQQFEKAEVERDPEEKRRQLTFVFVGAGLVGIELVGEMSEFLPTVSRAYRHVHEDELHYQLIEAGPRIAPEFEESISHYVARTLRARGVIVRDNTKVERIEPGRVHLPGGETIEAQTILLAAGVTPSPVVKNLPLEKSHKGAIVVDATMRVKDRPEIWALGDCASIPSPSGKPYPALAQHALREARVLAGNITSVLRGRNDLKPFVYATMGLLAALGHYNGVGRIKFVRIKGFIAWWVWRSYYLFQMPRWPRRLRIMMDWTVALFFHNDIVELDPVRERDTRAPAESERGK